MFIDSHAHLDDKKYQLDRDIVIQRAQTENLEFIINIGESVPSSKSSISLAETYSCIYAAVGIHPHHATEVEAVDLLAIKELAVNPKVLAIGEIGLDYYYYKEPEIQEKQRTLFIKQLEIAAELNLPVIIHNRESEKDFLNIFSKYGEGVLTGCMHCFSGDTAFAEECLALGLYISFAGQITFPKAEALRRAVKLVPLEKMLIETDCPYLAPQVKRGKRNEPAYLKYTAEEISKIKGVSMDVLARQTSRNVQELFRIRDRSGDY